MCGMGDRTGRDDNKTRTRRGPDPQTRIDWVIPELTGDGDGDGESPNYETGDEADEDGDEKRFPNGDGDGDGDEAHKQGWGWDTIQLEDAVSTISGEYLLEFTSEYGIPEGLHPELPGPEETIVDFPEVIGATKVSHFEINCRVLNIIPTLNLYRVFYVPSYNSGWMSFSKRPGKNTPQCYTKPLDSLKNWNNRFFWVDERIFPTVVAWSTSAPKDGMPPADSYSSVDVTTLNTRRTPIQKQPEVLLCLVGLSRNYFLGDDVYPTFLYDDDREMDLFNLISAPNPLKVKIEVRPRASHEVPLLTVTASSVTEMEDTGVASESSGTPSVLEKSPLDFADEDPPQTIAERVGIEGQVQDELSQEIPYVGNATTAEVVPETGECAAQGVEERSCGAPTAAKSVSDSDPLSYAKPQPYPEQDIAQSSRGTDTEIPTEYVATTEVNVQFSVGSPDSGKSTSVPSVVGSPGGIYQPGWGVTNDYRLDTPDACQDMVDHIVPPGYFSELRHLPNANFLSQYNINLARQVAMGSQLRLRSVDAKVHGLRNQTKNLKTLLEAEADMKKAAEAKNVSNLQAQVTGEERIKAAFKEFKKYEDDKVEQRCAEMDARLDALSIDFDEELYPHMLMTIACRQWVIRHGLRLAVLKCVESMELRQAFADVVSAGIAKGMSEGLKHGVEHKKAKLDLAAIEAYDPEAETKYVATLHALKNLKYPLVDQLKKLKDAPIDLIMASLYLNNPWSFKEEILLEDAIATNISRAEKKKKCRVVCHTHGVGSAHHARSDGILVLVPTVAPQGLAILLVDAATQTEIYEASPRLLRSKSLPPMYNLVWS
ncbi:hypothetical protein Tco_1108472 [Tanacetum coccineum]